MTQQKSNATDRPPPRRDEGSRSSPAGEPTPPTDLQGEDAGSAASGAANRGSPAAPVMKQFQKTRSEGTGRP